MFVPASLRALTMLKDIDIEKNRPKWDSGLGYLTLLDQIIKLTNNYLISAEWAEYYRTLESWYITAHYWLEGSQKVQKLELEEVRDGKKHKIKALDKLKKLRAAASEDQIGVLKRYHELLDKLTSLAGLRLASSTSGIPGVLKT